MRRKGYKIIAIFSLFLIVLAGMFVAKSVETKAEDISTEFAKTEKEIAVSANCPYRIWSFTMPLKSAAVEDDTICKVDCTQVFAEDEYAAITAEELEPGDCVIYPLKEGSTNLVVEATDGSKLSLPITVTTEELQTILSKKRYGLFRDYGYVVGYDDAYDYTGSFMIYGKTKLRIYAPVNAKVEVKIAGASYSETADFGQLVLVDLSKVYKKGTKGTVKISLGNASITKNFEVKSGCTIMTRKIKSKAKYGKFDISNVTKGDVVKVKYGKKTIAKKTIKKSEYLYTMKFKSKLKKGKKVKYYIYNKYGQKLASKSYTIGK